MTDTLILVPIGIVIFMLGICAGAVVMRKYTKRKEYLRRERNKLDKMDLFPDMQAEYKKSIKRR